MSNEYPPPCPFCEGQPEVDPATNETRCRKCNATAWSDFWDARPTENAAFTRGVKFAAGALCGWCRAGKSPINGEHSTEFGPVECKAYGIWDR